MFHAFSTTLPEKLEHPMTKPILIIGLPDAGPDMLPAQFIRRINQATLLVGGKRHLAHFPAAQGERLAITANIPAIVARLRAAQDEANKTGETVVLASGDPLWFGVGATLRRYFEPEELDVRPAPSSAQLAFAALGEPWAGAALLSAHARPIEEVVRACATVKRAAILTDPTHTPAAIADALLKAGHAPSRPVAIAENLGGSQQKVWRGTLATVAEQEVGRLNVLVLLPDEQITQQRPVQKLPYFLPEDAFVHRASLITKQEIRTLSLAALQPTDGIMWDIGAGSGSVGIEAALMGAQVWAVEKNEKDCAIIRQNIARFNVATRYHLTHDRAPAAFADWPTPDAIFIGGSGGALEKILQVAWQRLTPNGRLVVNLVVIENLVRTMTTLRKLDVIPEIRQISVSRSKPILHLTRFEALHPVWIVSAIKKDKF